MYQSIFSKFLSSIHDIQIKILAFTKEQIRNCLKNPLGIASLHCKTFQKLWLDTPLKFNEKGQLNYTATNKLTFYRLLEISWLTLYGILLCPFILYRHVQSNRNANLNENPEICTIYEQVSWIHKSLYILGTISGLGTVLLDRVLQQSSKNLQNGYNSLLKLQQCINQSRNYI